MNAFTPRPATPAAAVTTAAPAGQTHRTRHALARHRLVRLDGPLSVSVEQGVVWATVDGDPFDHLLQPGDCRRFDGEAPVLLYALGDEATFVTRADDPPRPWSALRRALRRLWRIDREPGRATPCTGAA